uniref:Reverse transcriptase domain-containing protein n=1 Tax=Tanacetum cinerariifolium TaxID=118510 RepID=A0A6L2KA23_TANCI|nr:hypothetical protein [Tanacetum cinerariifolium]
MNQQREKKTLLAAQREEELLAQKQAAQEKEEPPQNFDFRQLIGEICGTKVCEEQKQNIEDTMLELLEDCRQKELYCMHNDVEDLIESALNSKLFSINLKFQRLDKEKQEVKNIVEQAPNRRTRLTKCLKNLKIIHKKSSISLNNTPQISSVISITPDLPTEEPDNSLSMGDEHLSTILKIESNEVIKSSVKNIVSIPSESEVTSDNASECDVPVNDESSPIFTTFSNPLFDCNDDFTSSDDKSLSNEDVQMENFKIYSNPLFDDEEIISTKIDPHYFNSESNLLKSLLNRDTLINSSSKFDYFLEEFSELNVEIADMILESLSPSPIPVEDSNSQIEEIDSPNFDHYDDPSFPRPLPEPLDVEVFFDFEPDTSVLTTKVVKGISEQYVLMPNIFPTLPTLDQDLDFTPSHYSLGSGNKIFNPGIFIEVQSDKLLSREEFSISFIRDPLFDSLLPFSFKNEDKVFKPGILFYLLVSHQDKAIFDFSKNPMMMYGGEIPLLDVLIAPDLKASRARGLSIVHLSFNLLYMGIRYPRSY